MEMERRQVTAVKGFLVQQTTMAAMVAREAIVAKVHLAQQTIMAVTGERKGIVVRVHSELVITMMPAAERQVIVLRMLGAIQHITEQMAGRKEAKVKAGFKIHIIPHENFMWDEKRALGVYPLNRTRIIYTPF